MSTSTPNAARDLNDEVDGASAKEDINTYHVIQGPAPDRRWTASHGITFGASPQHQTWQPAQGINFSPGNLSPSRPYSIEGQRPSATDSSTRIKQTSQTRSPSTPKPRPYQPPPASAPQTSNLFGPAVAAEEALLIDDEDDLGELLERASKENMKVPSNVADVAIEDVKTDLSSGKLSAAVFSANPTVADQEKLPTYIVPIEEKAGKNLKARNQTHPSFLETSKSSLQSNKLQRNGHSSPLSVKTPKPPTQPRLSGVPPRRSTEDSSITSPSQSLSKSEIERLAQLPVRSAMTAANGRIESTPLDLDTIYQCGDRIRKSYHSVSGALWKLREELQNLPIKYSSSFRPVIIAIQDTEDEVHLMRDDMMHHIHSLREFMWRRDELQRALLEPSTAQVRAILYTLRLHRLTFPFTEIRRSRIDLAKAFFTQHRWYRRRGIKFLEKPLRGIKGRRSRVDTENTLRNTLRKVELPWHEFTEYQDLLESDMNADTRLRLVQKLGRSWRHVVFALKNAFDALKESCYGGAKAQTKILTTIVEPMIKASQGLIDARVEYSKARLATLMLDPSALTAASRRLIESDLGSTFHSETAKPGSMAVEDTGTPGASPKLATFKAIRASGIGHKKSIAKDPGCRSKTEDSPDHLKGSASTQASVRTENSHGIWLEKNANRSTQTRPLHDAGQSKATSTEERQESKVHGYDTLDYKQREPFDCSSTELSRHLGDVHYFVGKQKHLGHRTLTNVLDLQDVVEEFVTGLKALRGSMHLYRAAVKDRRTVLNMISKNEPADESDSIALAEYCRLRKLLMLQQECCGSVFKFSEAANNLHDFQVRRRLVPYNQSQRIRRCVYLLNRLPDELSEIVNAQYAKNPLNELDGSIVKVQHSLMKIISATLKYEKTLTAYAKKQFRAKRILTKEHIVSLRTALRLASPQASLTNSATEEDNESLMRTPKTATKRDSIFRDQSRTEGSETAAVPTRKSGEKTLSTGRPPSENSKGLDYDGELSLHGETTTGVADESVTTKGARFVESRSNYHWSNGELEISRVPNIAKQSKLLHRRPVLSSLSLPSYTRQSSVSEVPHRPRQSNLRRIKSECILSQGSMLKLQAQWTKRKKSLPHSRAISRKRLNIGHSQKRALHCASVTDSTTAENSGSSSTLPISSDNASCSSLDFRIRDYGLKEAPQTDPTVKPMHWEYTLYRGPLGEKVKVHYCKTKADTERISRLFFDEDVLGFDIEWKPNATARDGIKKNIALIQIASESRIALFHVARFPGQNTVEDLVPPTFRYIMQSPRITKVGVSIKADCTRLSRFMEIESRGLFELSHLYKLVKYSPTNTNNVDKRLVKLATQVEEHLGLPLFKGQDVRSSDWSADLNYQQVQYAASDSYAGFQLFHALENKRLSLDPTPPRPYHAELNLPIRLASGGSIPTDDEQTEIEEDSPTINDPNNSPCIEELARDFLNIKIKAPPPTQRKPSRPPPRSSLREPTPEFNTAQEWVTAWRSTLPSTYKPTAPPASLRAYALWHEQKHSVPEAAALLRDPPLQNATVAGYVIEALRLEKLPYDKEELREVLVYVPESGRGRYRKFIKEAGLEEKD